MAPSRLTLENFFSLPGLGGAVWLSAPKPGSAPPADSASFRDRANQRAAYRGDHSKGTEKRKLSGNPETAAASAYWSSSPDESSDRKTV
ncbi:hypothetical protein EYF80_060001 [Liparis tanakae]|uniref:Uncharacterized protein n=1 Tax=Liparis tanakae TaxID=230148 RepID=A0A4Z2ELK9_9TELE|nr:hypothetical protein EYF80_060001 [Liparis tanakae]